jgi:malate synthase
MNMPISDIDRRALETQSFTLEQLMFAVNKKEHLASHTLDTYFPLQNGSHKDVKQYVVYFRHIMAFFENGSHCGLENARQFKGYLGQSERPAAILLKQDNMHVEVILNEKASSNGEPRLAFPEERTFMTASGDDYTI